MDAPDLFNGIFETGGGLVIWMNIYRLYKDKRIRGVSFAPFIFFTLWGFWNLYYYPHLGQIMSFIGGIFVVTANAIWVLMAVYYGWKERKIG